jgi:hypothetical protein
VPIGTRPEDLHPHFRLLTENPSRYPSRSVFKEIAPWVARLTLLSLGSSNLASSISASGEMYL